MTHGAELTLLGAIDFGAELGAVDLGVVLRCMNLVV